jgi:uncharacterized iron-regulated membrane protein
VRRLAVSTHRWIGIALFAYVALLCVTGSVLVYRPELFRFFEPQPVTVAVGPSLLTEAQLLARAATAFPGETPVTVWPARQPDHAVEVELTSDTGVRGHLFDPYTGEPLRHAIPWDFWLVSKLLVLHTDLLGGESGRLVNGALGLGLVFLALTGVLVWRPRKRQAPSISTGRQVGGLRRLHMTVGIWAALFAFMWGLTGFNLAYPQLLMAVVDYFEPFDELNPVERIGDHVSYWFAYLHFGRFGGYLPGCERGSGCDQALKAIWALIAVAPAFLAISGFVLWRRGRRARAKIRALSAAAPANPLA